MSRRVERLREGARNALELLRRGRFGAPWSAPHEVVDQGPHHRLRRYPRQEGPLSEVGEALLLVPPLMVAADVYDISPELSAVSLLTGMGLDVWLVDFGAPEREEGGLQRTLDDHILAVSAAIDRVAADTGRPVHIAGYSQGGLFCYQVAAFRRSRDVASVITFGSPVDLRKSLPVPVRDPLMERLLRAVRGTLSSRLEDLDHLPGVVTSTGFKVFGARKELEQWAQLVRSLPDRDALARREPKRRFLGGEGFVAWPGPAFREFVDRVIVENRLTAGGLVIDGRAVALADITCPVLYFVGEHDDMARPAAVRGIRKAAPRAELHEVQVPAGHFGLVVGSRALSVTWPTVAEWMAWRAGSGEPPQALSGAVLSAPPHPTRTTDRMYQLSVEVLDRMWTRLGEVSEDMADIVHAMRWQLPRLARLESLHDGSRVNLGRALREQAASLPRETFFLWKGHAFTWADADRRVDAVLARLVAAGVAPGAHVAVWMAPRPDLLTAMTALTRMGAVPVPLPAHASPEEAGRALQIAQARALVCDDVHLPAARELDVRVLHLVSEAEPALVDALQGPVEPSAGPLPALDAGRAADTGLILLTDGGQAARVTNRRMAMAALATAAAGQLTPADTVYTCLPLHSATALMVAVGGAMAGGCRLALAPERSTEAFWAEVRRVGATVVVHDGALLERLVAAPRAPEERRNPVRLWLGPPVPPSVHQALLERFGKAGIVAFYASTEGNVVLADLDGEHPGSVGRPLVEGVRLALVRYDRADGALIRGANGRLQRCRTDEPGMLLGRIDHSHPVGRFEGYLDPEATERRIVREAFGPGDAWFHTGDVFRRDRAGVYWLVERRR